MVVPKLVLFTIVASLGVGNQNSYERKFWTDRYDHLLKAFVARDIKELQRSRDTEFLYYDPQGNGHHAPDYNARERHLLDNAQTVDAQMKILNIRIATGAVYVTTDWRYTIKMKSPPGENESIANGHEVRTDVWDRSSNNWVMIVTRFKTDTLIIGRMPRKPG